MTGKSERKSSDISTVTIADDTSIVSADDECSCKCRSSSKVITVITTTLKCITLVAASSTLLYGAMMMNDSTLTSTEANGLFRLIFFSSVSFTFLVQFTFSTLIFLGVMSAGISMFGLADCLCTKHIIKRKKIFSWTMSFLVLIKIICILMWSSGFPKVKSEAAFQMKLLFRHYFWLATQWNAYHIKFSCCGVETNTGLYNQVIHDDINIQWAIPNHVPRSCCQDNTYPDDDVFFTYKCPLSIREPCLRPLLDNMERYRLPILCVLTISAFTEVVAIIAILYEIKKLRNLMGEDEEEEIMPSPNVKTNACSRYSTIKIICVVLSIFCMVPCAVYIASSIALYFDKIFMHPMIKELWKAMEVRGNTFYDGLKITSIMGVIQGCVLAGSSFTGIFLLRRTSPTFTKSFLAVTIGQIVISWANLIWWILFVKEVEYIFVHKLPSILQDTFTSLENHRSYDNSLEGAWNNLFARNGCCGVTGVKDFEPIAAQQALVPILSSIPVYCCMSNPLTRGYTGDDRDCTDGLLTNLRYDTVNLLTRLRWYSTTCFVVTVVLLALLKVLVLLTILELKNAGVWFARKEPPRKRRRKSMRKMSRVGSVMYGPTYKQPPSRPAWTPRSIFQCFLEEQTSSR